MGNGGNMNNKCKYRVKLKLLNALKPISIWLSKKNYPSLDFVNSPTSTSETINELIKAISISKVSYLEIGLEHGNTFRCVRASYKVGVDPYPRIRPPFELENIKVKKQKSDAFFRENKTFFHFVYIDGLHTWDQTYKDLLNTLKILHKGGLILVDDVVPSDKYAAFRNQIDCQVMKQGLGISNNYWMGDVFKLVFLLLEFHPELEFATIVKADNNPQLVIWRGKESVKNIKNSYIAEFKSKARFYSYSDVFKLGIPHLFRETTLVHFIDQYRESKSQD
jgi:hypothetical protein